MYLLNVAIPPLPGRVRVTGAAQPLQQDSQSKPRRERGRSSRTPPATPGTTERDLRGQEKMTRPKKVCQVFLAPCGTSAAIPVRSRQGVLLPNPGGLQDLGWWVWWELRAQQDLWKQIALALRYGEQDLLGWVVSAVGIARWHIGCLAHCTERRGLVLVPSLLGG